MRVFVDDLRDPNLYLSKDIKNNVVWLKEAWKAKEFIFGEKSKEIEVLHLDNNLGDPDLDGEDLVSMIYFHIEMFPKLKSVLLHSSDQDVISKILEAFKEPFSQNNIELEKYSFI